MSDFGLWSRLIRRWRQRSPGRGSAGEIVRSGEVRYSQNREELIVRDFFGDSRGGSFVDVGAGDWRDGSTTLYLERHLGWSGIGVDARAEVAAGWRDHRPRSTFYRYVVTDHSGTTATFYEVGVNSSTYRDHLDALTLIDGLRVTRVPTITLDELLVQSGITAIDFLSLDIERGEPEALSGFDVRRYRPALVCIEVGFDDTREWAKRWFRHNGYVRLRQYVEFDDLNWWFTPR